MKNSTKINKFKSKVRRKVLLYIIGPLAEVAARKCSSKYAFLKHFAKFTEKHLYWSHF